MPLREIQLQPLPVERFSALVGERELDGIRALAQSVRAVAHGRRIWNVNSTAIGGGVAEMIRPLVSYARSLQIDARWVVIEGPPDFFRITKRLHNALHGESGDRSPLGAHERELFEWVSQQNAADLLHLVRPHDVVILHDPQTVGLAPFLVHAHVGVVWRCHIGRDEPNAEMLAAWRFLAPYLAEVPLTIFSRGAYVPPMLGAERATVVMPSIDPFSPKNQPMDEQTVHAILCHVGLVNCPLAPSHAPTYQGTDGHLKTVGHYADVIGLGPPPPGSVPLVLQVSRWDALKDPVGVMIGFARLVEQGRDAGAHLMLAGPNVHAIADDPDGAAVYADTVERWRALSHEVRCRVHLATLPTHDIDENAAIVNALQRHASVVVQKSLHEGFGLTVTEAMWKGRAVLASAVGGIQDQLVDGVSGLLLKDPNDLVAFGEKLAQLLSDAALRERLGAAAREQVRKQFLGLRSLRQYGEIIQRLDAVHTSHEAAEALH
jgi:trehalose synthase